MNDDMDAFRLYGDNAKYDDTARDELRSNSCVRSGRCCLQSPCPVAYARGERREKRCQWLKGDEPGSFSCALIEAGDEELIASVEPGSYCRDPRNMDRVTAAINQSATRNALKVIP